ncbi:MAG: 8-amino-7-oxononanoate synthase [Proteobacteria bacterium]|nr:8-amino-7-oxononanoate synthase [Pseudomonadota bacterium]
MVTDKYSFIDEALHERRTQNLFRRLRAVDPLNDVEVNLEGKTVINFSSNDYLGFSKHPKLKKRSIEYIKKFGTGSTASRLICGSMPFFDKIEEKLAELKGTEKTLIFNSGFQANISILPSLCNRSSLILSDSLNHNSLIQGMLLSRCKVKKYTHNDHDHLNTMLKESLKENYSRIFIVTESVFSMDGDQSDINSLVSLAKENNAFLIVDEAHATGVLGPRGMGLTCGKGVDLVIGTFGKACGSFGAYAACSKPVREYLINCCSGLIYSTALPPSIIGAIDAALDLIPAMEDERRELLQKAQHLRSSLNHLGYHTGKSTTQIIPVIIGEEEETIRMARFLEEKGILGVPIRPPSVEKGGARIRLSVTAAHSWDHIDQLIHAFKKAK